MQSLAERLQGNISKLSAADPEWVQFVKDYRSEILRTSQLIPVDPNIARSSRYRINETLEKLGVNRELNWITLWLSGIESNAWLLGHTELRVPNNQTIIDIYSRYKTSKLANS